jgi:tRNA A37 threonylcarbamoyladenosine dehydratase
MDNPFIRTQLLIGEDNLKKLKTAHVAVFGLGGVGGITCEALVRSGVGNITIIDNDNVDITNINRQIIATSKTVGLPKTQALKDRLLDINPSLNLNAINTFYLPENADNIDMSNYDYVIDAVDTVSAKLEIIKRAKSLGIPVISCMGTGGKLDASKLKVSVIEKTSGCPLARVMRKELKDLGISNVKVVFSEEKVVSQTADQTQLKSDGKRAPASMIFVPSVAGLLLAKEVVFDLIKE